MCLAININMEFLPENETRSFNPSNPNSGGNMDGKMFFGCKTTADKNRARAYWNDLNKQYGLNVKYYKNGYDLEEHDNIYGEHVTSEFSAPKTIRVLPNLENQNTILTQYGIITDMDIQFYIPIDEFNSVWGDGAIPNRGDLIELLDDACDRPEGQAPKIFQVTSKRDSANPADPFAGHYVWYLDAKRFDYSYEYNAPDEGGEPITNSTFVGILSSSRQDESEPLTYGPSADQEAKEDLNNDSSSDIYGGYL